MGFVATENQNRETVNDKLVNWWNLNKTEYPHLASYLAAQSFSVYFERFFSKAGNLYEKKCNRLIFKIGE